ncbi:probable serine/threonine-protein kinase PBL7 [Tanacetum coccineum]
MDTYATEPPTRAHIKGNQKHLARHQNHHDVIPQTTILMVVTPIVIVILLLAISLIVALLGRVKSSKSNGNADGKQNCMFVAHSIINFNGATDMKNGCIYGESPCTLPSATFKGVQVFTYRELESATDSFTEAKLVGTGGFGNVYRGVLRDGTLSAIKMLHKEGKQAKLIHLDEKCMLLVFEYMPNGTLCNHLHTLPWSISRLNWAIRLRIALDCVRALEFLHEHTIPSVIHSNFKYTNIMVSDFGFAKIRPEKLNGLISPRVLGTTGYLAPESVIYVSLWTIN